MHLTHAPVPVMPVAVEASLAEFSEELVRRGDAQVTCPFFLDKTATPPA